MPSLINCATASNASSTSSSTFDASPRATTAEPSTSSPPFISQVPSSGCAECRFALAQLAKYRALALLGEPGMGKSVALGEEAARIQGSAGDTISIHVDLRAFSNDLLLYQRVFESAEFAVWRNGTSHLVLHLDSLDEAI